MDGLTRHGSATTQQASQRVTTHIFLAIHGRPIRESIASSVSLLVRSRIHEPEKSQVLEWAGAATAGEGSGTASDEGAGVESALGAIEGRF